MERLISQIQMAISTGIILLISCQSLAQVTSQLRKVYTKRVVSPISGALELTGSQPFHANGFTPSTYVEPSVSYAFNSTYSAGVSVSALKSWSVEKDEDGNSPDSLVMNDTYLAFSRSDFITLTSYVGLPTSKVAKDALRAFSVSIEPSIVLEDKFWWFKASTELIHNQNAQPEQEVEGADSPEARALWTRLTLTYRFDKIWSWYDNASFYQSWAADGKLTETPSFTVGPQFRLNKETLFRLAYFTENAAESEYKMFQTESSGVSLSAFWKF